jgi:hypothetical protein
LVTKPSVTYRRARLGYTVRPGRFRRRIRKSRSRENP